MEYNKNKTIRGGYSCAMQECKNISGRVSGLSFFRFPKNPNRAKLWLSNCGRSIQVPIEQLYKSYRICENHFDSHMFLNDLKNRLQPHAVPKPMQTIIDDQSLQTIIVGDQPLQMIKIDQLLYVTSVYNPQHDNQISFEYNKEGNSKNEEILPDIPNTRQDQKIQTDATLLRKTSREKKLRSKICSLRREVQKLKQQLKQQESN